MEYFTYMIVLASAMQCDESCEHYEPCIPTCPLETCDTLLDPAAPLCTQDACVEGRCLPFFYLTLGHTSWSVLKR